MSNRATHVLVAVPSGAALAGYRARRQRRRSHRLVETAGGAVGGYLGGRLPDLIDPPTCPNHRGIGHSFLSISVAGTIIYKSLSDWQDWFRQRADEAKQRADNATDQVSRGFFLVAEFVLRFIAGLIAGVIGGYASHLALDFMTPCSLPLVARGF
jgi:hypothetical protein